MKRYRTILKEETYTSKYNKDLIALTKKYVQDIKDNGGVLDDAIASMCICIVQANFSISEKTAVSMLKNLLNNL